MNVDALLALQVPRYTSYPAVPHWNNGVTETAWKSNLKVSFGQNREISVYIHLPYCEKLCTYCACNKRITVNHAVEIPYIDLILKEWAMYLAVLGQKPILKDLHIGGGTPTFFAPQNIDVLLTGILQDCELLAEPAFSFEGHPNNTSEEHLKVFYKHGFRRLSLGVQDVDAKVQKAINRVQSSAQILELTKQARALGYRSVNYDLIYGLPFQTLSSIEKTLDLVKLGMPNRIALYSYAHVPWKSKVQRLFTDADLPNVQRKQRLYQTAKQTLQAQGYQVIGMDHFALADDELYVSARAGNLHRNFMGYTTESTSILIGLGASSISSTDTAYIQNEKEIEDYSAVLRSGKFAIASSCALSEQDVALKNCITSLMCNYRAHFDVNLLGLHITESLQEYIQSGYVQIIENQIIIPHEAHLLVRVICSAIDPYYRPLVSSNTFSLAV